MAEMQNATMNWGIGAIAPGRSRWAVGLWWFMVVSCIGVAGYSLQFFVSTPHDDHFDPHISMLRFHIAGGMGAMLFGPWQFSTRLRQRFPDAHRWLGRSYLVAVVIGAVAGFAMARVSREGIATHLGFGLLSLAWLFTAVQAYRSILHGRVSSHRRWMIRNFALSLAAVTLRNYLPLLLFGLHWSFRASYITVAWACWVPNLIVAEWFVRRHAAFVR